MVPSTRGFILAGQISGHVTRGTVLGSITLSFLRCIPPVCLKTLFRGVRNCNRVSIVLREFVCRKLLSKLVSESWISRPGCNYLFCARTYSHRELFDRGIINRYSYIDAELFNILDPLPLDKLKCIPFETCTIDYVEYTWIEAIHRLVLFIRAF